MQPLCVSPFSLSSLALSLGGLTLRLSKLVFVVDLLLIIPLLLILLRGIVLYCSRFSVVGFLS